MEKDGLLSLIPNLLKTQRTTIQISTKSAGALNDDEHRLGEYWNATQSLE